MILITTPIDAVIHIYPRESERERALKALVSLISWSIVTLFNYQFSIDGLRRLDTFDRFTNKEGS
jgi:hypothetical protein